jgi:hypothetical protein
MSIYKDLTGLRWLRKYFKSRGRHVYLGLGAWAGPPRSPRAWRIRSRSQALPLEQPVGDESDWGERKRRPLRPTFSKLSNNVTCLVPRELPLVNVDMDIADSKSFGVR